jgi:hypothetical protein
VAFCVLWALPPEDKGAGLRDADVFTMKRFNEQLLQVELSAVRRCGGG